MKREEKNLITDTQRTQRNPRPIVWSALCSLCLCGSIVFSFSPISFADEKPATTPEASLFGAMRYRLVGPFRGGRSCAVTGVPGKPQLFYFGSTGGGVWRTTDGGSTWENISDGFFGGSIGAVAV